MNFLILDPSMRCEESLDVVCIVFQGGVIKFLRHSSLIHDDHVVHDNASCLDLSEDLWLPILDMAMNNCISLLKHKKNLTQHPFLPPLDDVESEISCCQPEVEFFTNVADGE